MVTNIEMAVLPEYKIVFDVRVARNLIRDGYKLVDIKPKKGNRSESVFIFEVVPGFMEKMYAYNKEFRKKKYAHQDN